MKTPLQPALIIGLGGSGIEIVRRFRRRLSHDYPGATHVRFLGIDTDPQSQERPDLPRLSGDEFHHAGNFAMHQYVGQDSISNFPAIQYWWRSYSNMPFAFVSTGAGQRRPIGRLALFVHFDDVKTAIARQLSLIFQADSFNSLPSEYRRRLTVYIVSSTCGGTGTGMFLDLAFVARQLVPEVMPQVMPKVRSLLLMPSAFIGTDRGVPAGAHTALRANAFGALSELDWCMTKTVHRDPVNYPTRTGLWPVRRESLAFDSCFLLGNQDAQGAIYTKWSDLVERGSAHLQVTLASSLTKAGDSALDNVESWMGALPLAKGRAPMYSSMNADEIMLPSARIHARWTKQFARQLGDRLQSTATRDEKGPAAQALKDMEGSAGFGWLHRTLAKDGLRAMVPSLPELEQAARHVDAEKPNAEQLVLNAGTLHAEANRLLDRTQLADDVSRAISATKEEIDESIRRVLSAGSIDDALLFLSRVRERIDAMPEKARAERQRLSGDWLTDFGTRVRSVKKGLLQKKESFAKDLSIEAGQALATASLSWERNLWTRAVSALDDAVNLPKVRTLLDRRRDQLENVRALISSANSKIQSTPDPVVAAGMLAAISDAEMDAAYESAERQERLSVFSREHLGTLLADEVPSAESVAERLETVARKAVQLVAEDFVAGTQIRPELVSERLDRLQPLAVFTSEWEALSQGGVAERPQRLALLGLPGRMAAKEEAEKDIIGRLQIPNRETNLVPIADDDRVLMTTQHHGFPLFALAELADCRKAIDADAASRELRFTLPEQEARRWAVEPTAANASAQWFAVALALGHVRLDQVLGGYVYVEGTLTGSEQVLNQGTVDANSAREQARGEFLKRGLADGFKAFLSKGVTNGSGDLHERLRPWLTQEETRSEDPSYPSAYRTDLAAVKQYAASIQWV